MKRINCAIKIMTPLLPACIPFQLKVCSQIARCFIWYVANILHYYRSRRLSVQTAKRWTNARNYFKWEGTREIIIDWIISLVYYFFWTFRCFIFYMKTLFIVLFYSAAKMFIKLYRRNEWLHHRTVTRWLWLMWRSIEASSFTPLKHIIRVQLDNRPMQQIVVSGASATPTRHAGT